MRIILAILLSFACSAFAGGSKWGQHSRHRAAPRKTPPPSSDSGILRCAKALSGIDIVDRITSSAPFVELEKPALISGTRHIKLLIGLLADGSIEVLYAPITMGIFLTPALEKLDQHSLEKAVATENEKVADALDRVVAFWVGEVELKDGALIRAAYRDVPLRGNNVSVLERFIASDKFPWALPSKGDFKAFRLRGSDFHLIPFMNLDTSKTYGDFYESLGNSLSAVSRSFNFVRQCIDREELKCAQQFFKETASKVKTELNGAILQFEALAREDGFHFIGDPNPLRLRTLVEKASINPTIATKEDMEFFQRAIGQLSLLVNLSRPRLTLEEQELFRLIYILGDNGNSAVYPDYDAMDPRTQTLF